LDKKYFKYIDRGAEAVSGVLFLVSRAALAVLLIAVLTFVSFACIFTVYAKVTLSRGLELDLDDFTANLSSVIYYTDSETGEPVELTTIQGTEFRIWLEYDEIPKNVEHALVAIEDKRFYDHRGVDWYRTTAALVNMFFRLRDNFGGSTITQQLIKNVTGNDAVTVQRKFQEIFSALEFERKYSKSEIVQWYLNYIFWGKGAYGIAAAADTYFGKDVSELSIAETASLIAIPNNPSKYNPYSYPENNKKRQEDILEEMYIQGFITKYEYESAKLEPLEFRQGRKTINNQVIYTWFEEAVINEAAADLAELRGISEKTARVLLSQGGYSIYSTFDPRVQKALDDVYLDIDNLPKTTGSKQQLLSAMIIVDPYTGHIPGMSGNIGEKTGNMLLNRATMDLGRRPPGSSIKPVAVYGPAMEAGLITPDTKVDDSAGIVLQGRKDGWYPHNDDNSWLHVISLRTAIMRSRNTISAQILDKLTPAVSYRFLTETLGFKLEKADEDYAALALGELNIGATPQEMASAYTMFVNAGVRTEAITYTAILDRNGETVFENRPTQSVAISEKTAYWMTSILHDAAVSGTGSEANLGSVPTAGKTGTAGSSKDRWFVGYTPYYVAATWCGYNEPEPITMARRGNPSSQIWKRVMSAVHEGLPKREFSTPSDTYLPPVPGVKEADYTITYQTERGTTFLTETKTARVGASVTETATSFEDFEVVGDASQTITVNENSARNAITFVYRRVPTTPTPTPTPPLTPTPTPPMPPYEPSPTPSGEPPPPSYEPATPEPPFETPPATPPAVPDE
jgi:penicillin-binding protein 1A